MDINTENYTYVYSPFDVDMNNKIFDWIAFKEKYDQSPQLIKDLIFNLETVDFLKDQIALKFNLDEKQSKELSRIVRDILIVKIFLGNIVSEISSRLVVGPDVAKNVANQIINDLFAPALEEIKKLHMEKFGENKPTLPQMKSDEKVNPNNVLDLRK